MKKAVVKISIALLLAALCVFVFTGSTCLSDPKPLPYERREVGDFIVRFYDDYCEIEGTTEQGNSQRFLVIPEYIEGVKVRSLGYTSLLDNLVVSSLGGEALEKIYFEAEIEDTYYWIKPITHAQKIMYPSVNVKKRIANIMVYYPRRAYESVYEESVYGFTKTRANISYYYNYDSAENDGYYWVDDCDYGSTIEFIPPDPERDGYVFGGWYKEPECINEWDFETDTLPEEKKEMGEAYKNGEFFVEEIQVYQETVLYAKWTLKS